MKSYKNKEKESNISTPSNHSIEINKNRFTESLKKANKENTDNKLSFADNLLEICNGYRRENSELKIKINELENFIKIMKQQEIKDSRSGIDDLMKGFNDYQSYKTSLYDEYVTNMKNLYSFVHKLFNFYMTEERGEAHTKNYEMKMVMKNISEKGVQSFIGDCSEILQGNSHKRENEDLKMVVEKISKHSNYLEVQKSGKEVKMENFNEIGLHFQNEIRVLKNELEQLKKFISKESHNAILSCKESFIADFTKVSKKPFKPLKEDNSDTFKFLSKCPKAQIIKYANRSNSKSKSKIIKNDERCSLENSIELCRPPRPPLLKSCNKKRLTQPQLNITQELFKDFASKNSSFVCTPNNKRTKEKVESVKKLSSNKR